MVIEPFSQSVRIQPTVQQPTIAPDKVRVEIAPTVPTARIKDPVLSTDSCPAVLADDPAYLADDPLACAGSTQTIDSVPRVSGIVSTVNVRIE